MLALAELPVSLLHGSLSQQSHFSSYIWQHKWGKNLGKAKDYWDWKIIGLPISPEILRAPCSFLPAPKFLSPWLPLLCFCSTNTHLWHKLYPEIPLLIQSSLLPVLSVAAVLLALPFSHKLLTSALCRTQSTQDAALFQSLKVPGYFRYSSFSQLLPRLKWVKSTPLLTCSFIIYYSLFIFFSVKI